MIALSRRASQRLAFTVLGLAAAATVLPIVVIVVVIASQGAAALSLGFIFAAPREGMSAGGRWPAIVGTVYLTLGTAVIAVPLGLAAAIYLAEYARDNFFTRAIRIAIVNLAGVPSVVYGLFGLVHLRHILPLRRLDPVWFADPGHHDPAGDHHLDARGAGERAPAFPHRQPVAGRQPLADHPPFGAAARPARQPDRHHPGARARGRRDGAHPGKTSLAAIISHELGVNFRSTSGPVTERPGDLAALLPNLEPRDVLFIDEIHRLNHVVEEILYPAMEDFQLDIIIGQGPSARTIKLDLPPFTLVGATTRTGLLSPPLRDRFGVVLRLEFYRPEELQPIVTRSARILGVAIDDQGGREIARRSRGTPRIANRLLRRVRDFAQVKADGHITRRP